MDKNPVSVQGAIDMADQFTINVRSRFEGHSVRVSKKEFRRVWQNDHLGWCVDYYTDTNEVVMWAREYDWDKLFRIISQD